MTQKVCKKLVLLKNYYYRAKTEDIKRFSNYTNFVTNPLTFSESSIRRMTDKNFNNFLSDGFIEFNTIVIPPNNPNSGITEQTYQETVMIKTKCGFVSANTFYFDNSSSIVTTETKVDYPVTSSSGNLKNAVLVRIEYDNDGTILNKGKFARRLRVYGYACK